MNTLQKLLARLTLLTLIVRAPLWAITFTIPALRPRRSWPILKALNIRFIRFLFAEIGWSTLREIFFVPDPQELRLGKGIQGVYIPAAPPSLITGKLRTWAEHAGVRPARVPAYWITSPSAAHENNDKTAAKDVGVDVNAEAGKDEQVLLFFHGGGYVAFSAHPSERTSRIPVHLLRACGPNVRRALALEYRLASLDSVITAPTTPTTTTAAKTSSDNDINAPGAFPSQLLDALAAYTYLIHTLHFSSSQIILVGDSAGGNLALALTRYLVEHRHSNTASKNPNSTQPEVSTSMSTPTEVGVEKQKDLELPAVPSTLILLSPWADLSGSWCGPGSSTYTNAPTDYLGSFSTFPPRPYIPVAPESFVAPFLSFPGVDAIKTKTKEGKATEDEAGVDGANDAEIEPWLSFAATNPYISPASKQLRPGEDTSFKGFPRTFIAGGSAEMIIDSIRALADRMKASLDKTTQQVEGGGRGGGGSEEGEQRETEMVEYYEAEDAVHDYMCLLFMEPETGETTRRIAAFLKKGSSSSSSSSPSS